MQTMTQNEYRTLLKKQPATTEHDEQVAFIRWCHAYAHQCPDLAYVVAVPNGGKRSIGVARKMKAEGVSPGYPDLLLDVARGPYHGWRCEMKIGTGRLSNEQKPWMARLIAQGFRFEIAWGWIDAARGLCAYLGREPAEFGL